jgi:hypothetical protein
VSEQLGATEAVHAEIDAIQRRIERLQAAVEQYQDTDAAEVNWGHVGDLAMVSNVLDKAIAHVQRWEDETTLYEKW